VEHADTGAGVGPNVSGRPEVSPAMKSSPHTTVAPGAGRRTAPAGPPAGGPVVVPEAIDRAHPGLPPFETWYRVVHPRIVATLTLATGRYDEAAEAADEAMARALERWDRVARMDRPDGWAYRVAFNVVRSRLRRRALERRLLHRAAPVQRTMPAPAGEAWSAVRFLSRRQREVIVLRYIADLPRAEIAHVLGISEGTVGSTLFDASRTLRTLLDDDDQEST
jgi:DNA-directed RNA polymerase specialized sigma24 family protein